MENLSGLIEAIFHWGQTQSLWLQVFLVMVTIVIGLAILFVLFTLVCMIWYFPSYLLARYLGILSLFIIIPAFAVMVTNNGEHSPLSLGVTPLLLAAIPTIKGA